MKIKLDLQMAYLIGLWKARKCSAGLGIRGGDEIREVFAKKALERLKIPSTHFKLEKGAIFFFHSAYRKYFQETEKRELEIFSRKNGLSASFLAGYFDGKGAVEQGTIYFARPTETDRSLIERLGFKTIFRRGRLYLVRPREFIVFILPFVSHSEHKQKLGALVQSGNERDPRLQLQSGPPGHEHSVGTAYVK
jgi:hypothetical protein